MKPGSLLACLVLAVALVPASCRDSLAPERRQLTAVGSAFDGSPDGNYLQLIDGRPAVGTDGSLFLLPEFAPAPETEVEPVKLLVPAAEPAPEPAAAAPPPQQSKSLGSEVGQAAAGVVADALDTVADVFRGRRRHLLQTTASPPQTEQPQELAAELAPTVAAALNTTREQLNDLLDVLDSFIPVGATDAEASLIESGPAFMAAIEGPLNDTAESLASTLLAAAEDAGLQVYTLLEGVEPGQLEPFNAFMDGFVPAFVRGVTQAVLDVAYAAPTAAESVIAGFNRRRRRNLLQGNSRAAGTRSRHM
ncbi:hypothetical protein ACK3TF_004075 [Chlorella vulgaris]